MKENLSIEKLIEEAKHFCIAAKVMSAFFYSSPSGLVIRLHFNNSALHITPHYIWGY